MIPPAFSKVRKDMLPKDILLKDIKITMKAQEIHQKHSRNEGCKRL